MNPTSGSGPLRGWFQANDWKQSMPQSLSLVIPAYNEAGLYRPSICRDTARVG